MATKIPPLGPIESTDALSRHGSSPTGGAYVDQGLSVSNSLATRLEQDTIAELARGQAAHRHDMEKAEFEHRKAMDHDDRAARRRGQQFAVWLGTLCTGVAGFAVAKGQPGCAGTIIGFLATILGVFVWTDRKSVVALARETIGGPSSPRIERPAED